MRPLIVTLLALSVACTAKQYDSPDAEEDLVVAACRRLDPSTLERLADIPRQAARCDLVAPPAAKPTRPWKIVPEDTVLGSPNHRGRDVFFAPDEPQWVLGKFAYGILDSDLQGEEVDIYVLRDCDDTWEPLGTATTTDGTKHETVEGVEDSGGRVYFRIPDDRKLGIGRHRVRMVVAGDGTTADQYIEVLPKGTPIFVSDVDGTLTERREKDLDIICDEESDFPALWRSLFSGTSQPRLHEGAANAFASLVARGYRPMYLTARPEWLAPHTLAFLDENDRHDGRGSLPQGIVHTTLGLTGATNSKAAAFKKEEIQRLRDKGFSLAFGFGNRQSDVAAYDANDVPFRFYFENQDTSLRQCSQITNIPLFSGENGLRRGDWRIQSYESVRGVFEKMSVACE